VLLLVATARCKRCSDCYCMHEPNGWLSYCLKCSSTMSMAGDNGLKFSNLSQTHITVESVHPDIEAKAYIILFSLSPLEYVFCL
jgi:hypothetical protein